MSIPCSFFPFSFFIFIFMHWLLFDAKSFPPRCPPMTTLLPGLSTPRVYSGSGLPDGVSGSSPRVGPCQDAMFSRVSVCNPRLPRNCSHPNNPANVGFAWWWQFGTVLESRLEIGPHSLPFSWTRKETEEFILYALAIRFHSLFCLRRSLDHWKKKKTSVLRYALPSTI